MEQVVQKKPTEEIIKPFFFEAMRNGWVAGCVEKSIPDFSGSRVIRYKKFGLSLADYFFIAPDSQSSHGMTIIWLFEEYEHGLCAFERPVWIMHYGGWYDKRVIPFLKRTLMHNYNDNIFVGGRGPERLEGMDHTVQYLNRVEQNDFTSFRGQEQIITTSEQWQVPVGTKMGEHHYFGGLFI